MTTPDPTPGANAQRPQQEPNQEPNHTEAAAAAAAAEGHDAHSEQQQPQQDGEGREEEQRQEQQEEEPKQPAPGPRATRLHDIYAQGLRHTLSKLSPAAFAGCYPTVAFHSPRHLEQIQQQSVARLGERAEREYADIMARRAAVARLNELDGVVGEAVRRRRAEAAAAAAEGADAQRPTPPHLLPPQDILAAHMHPALSAHQAHLAAALRASQSANARLWDEVDAQRREIGELLARLEGVVGDVRGANRALGEVAGALSAEGREGREAVRGVDGEA
ncbi:hypothetical protein N3K66_001924 [Trichothecium roseum]|uniref:Uncharacterized protein n=1 Tax=Trichothecium roseum TaxID=47278 RepID=A0ACC0V9K1_9HYPO|nr:hypothetical protein N3K66_001924 [Trichothecium roseum]